MRLHGQGGKDLHRAETAVVKKTLSPQWDKRFRFRGKLRDYVHGVLELKVRDSDRLAVDNDIGGIELALSEIAFGRIEHASLAISPPQFDGAMRHLLLRKQRTGKASLEAGDCGHLAFTLTFTPDNAAVDAAGAKKRSRTICFTWRLEVAVL